MHQCGYYVIRASPGTTYQFGCEHPMWVESGPDAGLDGKHECYNFKGQLHANCTEFADRYKLMKVNSSCSSSGNALSHCYYTLDIEETLTSTNISCKYKNTIRFLHFLISAIRGMRFYL